MTGHPLRVWLKNGIDVCDTIVVGLTLSCMVEREGGREGGRGGEGGREGGREGGGGGGREEFLICAVYYKAYPFFSTHTHSLTHSHVREQSFPRCSRHP